MHAVCSAEETHVDVLEGNVAVDDTGDDDLVILARCSLGSDRRHTVGRAIP